jgi:hypothetical protein
MMHGQKTIKLDCILVSIVSPGFKPMQADGDPTPQPPLAFFDMQLALKTLAMQMICTSLPLLHKNKFYSND